MNAYWTSWFIGLWSVLTPVIIIVGLALLIALPVAWYDNRRKRQGKDQDLG